MKFLNKVEIDNNALSRELKRLNKTKRWLSAELGRDETYVSKLATRPMISPAEEKLICVVLDLQPGTLVKQENNHPKDAQILENLYKEVLKVSQKMDGLAQQIKAKPGYEDITRIAQTVERMEGIVETVYKKTNANTVQLEKIKEAVARQSESESDRAEKYLTEKLSCGEVTAQEIFEGADEMCIKRAELMRAKGKLDIQVYNKGYGKNQKAMWRLD